MSAAAWIEQQVELAGPDGRRWPVTGHVINGRAMLSVTPNQLGPEYPRGYRIGRGYRITHTQSGRALWSTRWPLRVAKAICAELVELPGWDRDWVVVLTDDDLRSSAERIARAKAEHRQRGQP
jgi:hypothetical protein